MAGGRARRGLSNMSVVELSTVKIFQDRKLGSEFIQKPHVVAIRPLPIDFSPKGNESDNLLGGYKL